MYVLRICQCLYSVLAQEQFFGVEFQGIHVYTLLLKNIFSGRIDALSHWRKPLKMFLCSARAESFFLFSKRLSDDAVFNTGLNDCICFAHVLFTTSNESCTRLMLTADRSLTC